MEETTGPAGVREAGEVYLTPTEAAESVGLSRRTLEGWRRRGGGPPYVRINHKIVRYPERLFHEWLAARLFSSTSDEAAREITP